MFDAANIRTFPVTAKFSVPFLYQQPKKTSESLCGSDFLCYLCSRERVIARKDASLVEEGPAPAEEALCSKLADGNVGNFQQQGLIKAGGQNGFHANVRGAVSPFSFIRFSYDLHPELARQSRASAVWVWDLIFIFPNIEINTLKIKGI